MSTREIRAFTQRYIVSGHRYYLIHETTEYAGDCYFVAKDGKYGQKYQIGKNYKTLTGAENYFHMVCQRNELDDESFLNDARKSFYED